MKSGELIASAIAAILGIALVAVIVQSPNTSSVITASGNQFVNAVKAATNINR